MAVDHVIAVADPVDVDGRQLRALDHLAVDARPAVAQSRGGGQKPRVEVLALRHRRRRPDDLVDRDLLDPAIRAAFGAAASSTSWIDASRRARRVSAAPSALRDALK